MKTIKLKRYGIGRYSDVSPFPLGDLELTLDGIPNTSSSFRMIASCNGRVIEQSTVSCVLNRVTIPQNKLSAGRFSVEVQQYDKGMMTKVYKVEDLLITQFESGAEADPEIAQMIRKIDALTAENASLVQTVAELESAVETAKTERGALDKRISTLEENNDLFNA